MTMREVLKHIIFFGFCLVAVSAVASEARAAPAWLTKHKHGVLIASKASVSVTPNHVSDSAPSGVAFEMSLIPPLKQKNEVAIDLVPIVRPQPPRQVSDDPVTPPRQGSVDHVTPPSPRQLSDDPVTPPRQGSVDHVTPPRQLSDDPVTPPRQGSVDHVTPPKKVVNCSPIMKNEGVIASVPIVRPRPPPPPRQVSANHVTFPKSTKEFAWFSPPIMSATVILTEDAVDTDMTTRTLNNESP